MNTDKAPDKNTVREQLLDHAQVLLMTRGYNGFSYRDLSALVGREDVEHSLLLSVEGRSGARSGEYV